MDPLADIKEVSKERVLITQALDLAIQAWRTVPSARDRITEAIAAVGRLDERAETALERLGRAEAVGADLARSCGRMLRHGQDFWERHQHSPESDEMSGALTDLYMALKRNGLLEQAEAAALASPDEQEKPK